MICVIHQHGTSFKGLMAYLMHDQGHAPTSDRVGATAVQGLATDDPDLGWKTMVATAVSQDELKQAAGGSNAGRKTKKHVMHATLSWHPEERDEISHAEMIEAAQAALTYIGTDKDQYLGKNKKTGKEIRANRTQHADEHQAIFVVHDEGPGSQPHVHICLNRVHPETGVILPDHKDYEKLSAWALGYRQAQGKEHYCPQRVINAAKRGQGFLTSNRRKPRSVYEAEQEQLAAEPGSDKAQQLATLRAKAKALKKATEAKKKTHAAAMHKLESDHLKRIKTERTKTVEAIRTAKARVKANYAPKIEKQIDRQQAEIKAFKQAKSTVAGRVRNTWTAFKTKKWMTEIRTQKLQVIPGAFRLAFSSGLQQNALKEFHAKEQKRLTAERDREERKAARDERIMQQRRLTTLRQKFERDRLDVIFKRSMERAKLKAEWKQLEQDRLKLRTGDQKQQRPDTGDRYEIPLEEARAMSRDIKQLESRNADRNKNPGQEPDQSRGR